jgi:hypothetical protein
VDRCAESNRQANETKNVLKPSKVLILMTSVPLFIAAAWAFPQGVIEPLQTTSIDDLMKATKLIYKNLESFYSLKFDIPDSKRKQEVFVRKAGNEYRSLKVNEVFGLVWESDKPATTEQLLTIFQKRFKMGGLIYELPSATQKLYRIRYAVSMPLNSTPETAAFYINIAATTGDDVEKELNPGQEDKF